MPFVILGFEQLSITNTAGGFQDIPSGVSSDNLIFEGRLETADVRVRYDGIAPTASIGRLIRAEEPLVLRGKAIAGVSFIRTGSTSATLNGTYYRIR